MLAACMVVGGLSSAALVTLVFNPKHTESIALGMALVWAVVLALSLAVG